MSELLKFENVSFSYSGNGFNNFQLSEISFKIKEGDFVSVIGKNGSGKSTVVKLISKILTGYEGSIFYNGDEIQKTEGKEYSRAVSYIPQTTVLINENLSVKEMLLLGRYASRNFPDFRNSKEDYNIVSYCMQETGITDFYDKNLSELSGGEKQKVMITLGLIQLNIMENLQNKILIIDEPLTYLDVNYQIEILNILKKLNQNGLTIIIVIHDLSLALNFTSKTVLMNNGKMILFSDTEKVITEEMLREHFFIESEIINYENKFLINYSF